MGRLHLMGVFVAVAEEQSFAGGARRLGMSAPAVTRAIAALETHLGVKLLARTTRHVRVTEAGQRYLADARRILAEVDEADEAAAGITAAPRGQLTLTAPVLFGRLFVTPVVVEYLQRHAEAQVSALFVDRVVNLIEEGIDVGVRIAELPDSSLQAIHVGRVRRVVCAAPAYLAAHGTPHAPQDLVAHTLITATAASATVDWKFAGSTTTVRVTPRLSVNSNDAAIEAAVRGLGITRLLSYQVAHEIGTGRLLPLLEDHEPPALPIHVLHREGRHKSARVRAFVDLAVERLRAEPALA